MTLPEVEAYILDPESEPDFEVDEDPHRPQRLLQGSTGPDQTSLVQNNQHHLGSIEVTLEPEANDHMSDPETPAQTYEEGDVSEEEEEEEEKGCDKSSDEDWDPQTATEWDELLKRSSSDGDSDEGLELSDNENTLHEPKIRKLCTDCGSFHYSKNHKCEHKTKPYVCNICGKRCVTEASLKLHCYIHSETYEHYCKYCYGTFKTKTDKLNHEQTHQKQSKPYKCPDCNNTYASLKDRRKHMKSHKGPDEFKCDICGLTFVKKHKPRHMLIHTGAKPYKCSICERTFNQSGNLKSHMRLHTGERPYKCQYCDKAFNHNISLKSHVERYHPLESGNLLDKIYDNSADTHDGTGGDSGDNEQKKDPDQMQKPKGTKYCTVRPLGRPKRNSSVVTKYSKSSEENSYDSNDDLTDFHQEQMERAEKGMKRKYAGSKRSSDSDYDPNEEPYTDNSRKRGRPRKV